MRQIRWKIVILTRKRNFDLVTWPNPSCIRRLWAQKLAVPYVFAGIVTSFLILVTVDTVTSVITFEVLLITFETFLKVIVMIKRNKSVLNLLRIYLKGQMFQEAFSNPTPDGWAVLFCISIQNGTVHICQIYFDLFLL